MNNLIKISIRLFLIFFIFEFVNNLAASINNFIEWNNYNEIYQNNVSAFEVIISLVPFIIVWFIYLFIAIFLWKKSEYIANKIIGNNQVQNINLTLDFGNILSVGLIVIGVYLFINSIPRLFSYLSNFAISKTRFVDKDYLREYTIKEIVEIIGIIIKIITSYMLIKYNNKIVNKIIEIKSEKLNVA